MALNVIPNDLSILRTWEKRVAIKIKSIYSNSNHECYLYVQPRLKNLNPDFILIDAYKGISVIEVKAWSREYLKKVYNTHVIDVAGKRLDNPMVQANQYFNFLKNLLQSKQQFFDEKGNFELLIYSRVLFPNIKSVEMDDLFQPFNQPPSECITSEQLRKLNFNNLFSEDCRFLDSNTISAIRGQIFPEIKVRPVQSKLWTFNRKSGSRHPIISTLDGEQEKFARKIPYGHYMITGVPGSGKTVILLSRAIHLLKEKPGWKICILTYNRPLADRLNKRFEKMYDDLELMAVNYQNIKISTFHSLATELSTAELPFIKNQNYWDYDLPFSAMRDATELYDAVLIDEYQDFLDLWIQLCLKICKTHNHNGVETKNLFLAGDRLQSIYNSREHSWKNIGVNIVGRSKLLKTSYRSGSSHVNLALDYLMTDDNLKKEIEKFYEGRDGVNCVSDIDNSIDFITGDIGNINNYINSLFEEERYTPEDIVILVTNADNSNVVYMQLDDKLKLVSSCGKDLQENKMNITSYHRSKGLEYKVCILYNVDNVKNKKVLYVGMTRASEKLCIHSKAPEGGEIFNDLISCYNRMVAPVEPESLVYDGVEETTAGKKAFPIEEIQKEFPNAYTSWSRKEELKVIDLFDSGKDIKEIAELIGRQPGGVKARLKKLGMLYYYTGRPTNNQYLAYEDIENEMIDDDVDETQDFRFETIKKVKEDFLEDKQIKSNVLSKQRGFKWGLKNRIQKLTSFMLKPEMSVIDDEVEDIKTPIVAESSSEWVHTAMLGLERTSSYRYNKTAENTYELLTSGYGIHDIADRRALKVGTIISHLISLAIAGKEIPYSVVSGEIKPDDQLRIVTELKKNGFIFKAKTKEALGEDITYNHINLTIALLISCNKNNS